MGTKQTTILAVDDEPRLLKFVAFNLASEGFAALTTTDGRHALELVKTHSPDLVLTDQAFQCGRAPGAHPGRHQARAGHHQ